MVSLALATMAASSSSVMSMARLSCVVSVVLNVGGLPYALSRIACDREINLQQFPIADLLWVVGDANRFRVSRGSRADEVVMRVCLATAGISRHSTGYSF